MRLLLRAFIFSALFFSFLVPKLVADSLSHKVAVLPTQLAKDNDQFYSHQRFELEPFLQVLSDTSQSLTFLEVLENKNDDFIPYVDSLFVPSSVKWYKFTLKANDIPIQEYYVNVDYNYADKIELYEALQDTTWNTKILDLNPSYSYYDDSFFIRLERNQTKTFYIRTESSTEDSSYFSFALINKEAFLDFVSLDTSISLLASVILIIMAIYNFFLFLIIRDKSILFYVVFLLSFSILYIDKVFPASFWLDIENIVPPVLIFGYAIFTGYIYYFLQLQDYFNFWATFYKIQIVVLAILSGLTSFLFFNIEIASDILFILFSVTLLINTISNIIICVRLSKQGQKHAFYLLIVNSIFYAVCFIAFVIVLYNNIFGNIDSETQAELFYRLDTAFAVSLVLQLIFYSLLIGYKTNKNLEGKVAIRTQDLLETQEELRQQNEEITITSQRLEETSAALQKQNDDTKASINYAKRIQDAMLPSLSKIKESFDDAFILFKPKDIVSGDFYWFFEEGDTKVIVVADCTGHGVPGAFMSMVGNELLNETVIKRKILEPSEILINLHNGVYHTLKQDQTENQDGMDMVVCVIKDNENLAFAGAKNPLLYIQEDEIVKIKGSSMPIGGSQYKKRKYETHTIKLEKGITIYLFSDGYQDQFGGENDKKIRTRPFYNLLHKYHKEDMNTQKEKLETFFENWKGSQKQIDDVTLIGIKIK
ncbi:SpoIIE family protein phosphatase [Bernardetia sp. ABR2-2B]|uniref:SpoIIE family protein phosphatase n=1 Tax=Bernardetia sp. ABR2-2B TaxID=3127472 RepID=UPI0030D37325